VSVGLLGGGSLRRLAQLPVCNQEELVCVSKRDGLSRAETAGLIALWQQATDGAARQYLLKHPREALRRARQGTTESVDPRLGPAGQELQKGLVLLSQVSLRLQRRLNRGIGEVARVVMGRALRQQQDGAPQAPVPEPPERVRAWLEGLHVEDSDLEDYDQLIAGEGDEEGGDDHDEEE